MTATALTTAAGVDDALLIVDSAAGSGIISGSIFQIGSEILRARFVTNDDLRIGVDRGYNGSTRATHAIGAAVVSDGIVDGSVHKADLAGGFLKVALATGGTSGTDVTVAAIAAGDELVSVLSFATAAAIATVADRTSEYAIQAGGLDKSAGTNETGNQLVIIYLDLT